MKLRLTKNTVTPTLKKLFEHIEGSKLIRSIANIALSAVNRNFVAGGRSTTGATGTWPKLKESTLLMRRKGGGGAAPLRDTGALMNGIHPEFSGNKVSIATAGQPYDAIHHFGGVTHPRVTARMKGFMWSKFKDTGVGMFAAIACKALGSKLTVTIPPRPYLMLTDPDVDEIKDFALRFKPVSG